MRVQRCTTASGCPGGGAQAGGLRPGRSTPRGSHRVASLTLDIGKRLRIVSAPTMHTLGEAGSFCSSALGFGGPAGYHGAQ